MQSFKFQIADRHFLPVGLKNFMQIIFFDILPIRTGFVHQVVEVDKIRNEISQNLIYINSDYFF